MKSDIHKGTVYKSRLWRDDIIKLCEEHTITHFRQDKLVFRAPGIAGVAPFLFTESLIHLDLSDNQLEDKGAIYLAAALKRSPNLTYLDIQRNGITSEGSSAIVESIIENKLSNLTLKMNSDNVAIAKLISHCPGLTSLEVLNMTDECAEPVLHALKTNNTLQELVLKDDKIRNNVTAQVDDCFEQNATVVRGSGPWGITRYIIINQLCKTIKNANELDRRSVPKQIETREDIEVFLRELIRDGIRLNSLKLAFLGDGEVGKTSLLNAIRDELEKDIIDNKWFYKTVTDFMFYMFPARTVGVDQSVLIAKGGGELLTWDFGGQHEYAVTHQFFLSKEMVVYIICYDLSQPKDVQEKQLRYWLDFLSSALSHSASSSSRAKWKVITVGTKLDQSHPQQYTPIATFWPKLPIHNENFSISSRDHNGVDTLWQYVEDACNEILQHSIRIPQTFKLFLQALQTIPEDQSIISIEKAQNHASGLNRGLVTLAIKYLHAIGRLVMLKDDLICTSPRIVPKITAQFISPTEFRQLFSSNYKTVQIGDEQVSIVEAPEDPALKEQVQILEGIGVCFKLASETESKYLFPSQARKADNISFTTPDEPHLQVSAIRFEAPSDTTFVPGFFCQLLVAFLEKLSVSLDELVQVHSNCISVSCKGVFCGELLLTIDDGSKSIVGLMRATNPDISLLQHLFNRVTKMHAPQYQSSAQNLLCPACISGSYSHPKFPHNHIGVTSIDDDGRVLACSSSGHISEDHGKPRRPLTNANPTEPVVVLDVCWTHQREMHHFYLSYCHATEGVKSSSMSSENELGLADIIYHKLATTKKITEPILVYWDKKCFNFGQNWANGLLHGMISSKVIIVLISRKVIERITKNAPKQQDDSLVEYPTIII